MTDQPPQFTPPPPTGNLTGRQRTVYAFLTSIHPDGAEADEVGALLHALGNKHDRGVRCDWCGTTGREVLTALRSKGLAKQRRGVGWIPLQVPLDGLPSQRDDGYDPAAAEIPY